MNLVKLIEQTIVENQIPPIQKDAKYFQNLSYRQGIHSGRIGINWKTGKPFTSEEIAAAKLTPLTPEEEAELLAYEKEQRRQQDSFARARQQDYRKSRGAEYS
jgi:hypothetical protein